MRLGDPHERRVERAVSGVVALAAVHVADERLVRVAPAHPAASVHVHRSAVSAELGEYLVLAEVDALVSERHRGRGLLAAQRMALVDESDARDDVRAAQRALYRVVGGGPDQVQSGPHAATLPALLCAL